MKTIFALLILILSPLACFGAEDGETKLPKAMEPIIAKLNSARAEAASKAIKDLQKLQGDLTKKNDLEGAMAVKNYIETLQKSIADDGAPQAANANLFTKVEWGLDGNWVDVTPEITAMIEKGVLDIRFFEPVESALKAKHRDPAFGSFKFLRFTFANKKTKSFPYDSPIRLPER